MYCYLLFTNLAGELTSSRNGSSISEIPLWQTINDEFFFSITGLGSNLHNKKIYYSVENKNNEFRKIPG